MRRGSHDDLVWIDRIGLCRDRGGADPGGRTVSARGQRLLGARAGHDELLRISPLGQVPVLVPEEGIVLSESAAILLWLAERYPHSGLLPSDPRQRARSLRGLVFIAANCYAAISLYDYPERWCQDCDPSTRSRIQAATVKRLHRLWEIFADLMEPSPWLSGSELGAVDLLAAVVSRWSGGAATWRQPVPPWQRSCREWTPTPGSPLSSRSTGLSRRGDQTWLQ